MAFLTTYLLNTFAIALCIMCGASSALADVDVRLSLAVVGEFYRDLRMAQDKRFALLSGS